MTNAKSHQEALSKLTDWQKTVIDALMGEREFCGQIVYVGGVYNGRGGEGTLDYLDYLNIDDPPEDEEDTSTYTAWDKYTESLPKEETVSICVGDEG
jgi:hypothetical protein